VYIGILSGTCALNNNLQLLLGSYIVYTVFKLSVCRSDCGHCR